MTRRIVICGTLLVAFLFVAVPAFACGGLLSPNGSVSLLRTTTLAGYHDGIEHYLTSFRFTGGGGAKFGSIVPLPGIPSSVERGGDWTLQRLIREVRPVPVALEAADGAFQATALRAEVILEKRIDALDITVLKGGGAEVARWAVENGFELSPDAPEVLEFYARRSPIFMAARFDSTAAAKQGLNDGDGTPIHLTIPTQNPWVPLRILALGKKTTELVEADVFLLTDWVPAMLPAPQRGDGVARGETSGLILDRSEAASERLLADLRSDKGMGWIPEYMWLSYLRIETPAAALRYDLALDVTGAGKPSLTAAGLTDKLQQVGRIAAESARTSWPAIATLAIGLGLGGALVVRRLATPTI